MPAPDAAALLRRNATDPSIAGRPAVKFGDRVWTHAEYVEESCRFANLFLERRPPGDAPFHVAVLLDNTPDYLFAFGGAAVAGATVVGLNHTRPPDGLLRDARHTDVALLVTEPHHEHRLAPVVGELGLAPGRLLVSGRFPDPDDPPAAGDPKIGESLEEALAGVTADDPGLDPDPSTRWALIFTSGTSAAPKAVVCSQRRLLVTGNRMGMILDIGSDDCGYVCMPLFHSNGVMVGWAPSVVYGASVGLARRFSVSRWLPDVRAYGATWFSYTGKPLSYLVASPEQPDDAANPLRVAFGNEGSPEVVAAFARRFGVEVIDAFGATEGGIAVNRDAPDRAGSLGLAGETVKVVDDDGNPRPPARFDAGGGLANADECVGHIVNTAGAGPFEGYYNNEEANAKATRFGWYWSGDLGYIDDDGYLYFAGRDADWIRVDGENFPAGPIESVVSRHPDVTVAAVYGVPDEAAGDQVMGALVLRDGAAFDPAAFAAWLDAQADLGPKWRPRYLRVASALPTTGTNKVLVRELQRQKVRRDLVGDDGLYVRERGDDAYRPFTTEDETALLAAFDANSRRRFWDL